MSTSDVEQQERKPRRMMVVSNRLPVKLSLDDDGNQQVEPSPGGLVTALNPVLSRNRGTWLGWVGDETDGGIQGLLDETSRHHPYDLKAVPLSKEEENLYYRGFSNEVLWPLFHDLLGYCRFSSETWAEYRKINERFADHIIEVLEPNDVVWIHDYQLILVGKFLREKGVKNPLLYFLHIPFPSSDLYRRLPWRQEIIEAMTAYDTVGFQTKRDRHNFVETLLQLIDDVGVRDGEESSTLFLPDRRIRAGNWAISIDYDEFYEGARTPEVQEESWLFHEYYKDQKIILGLDRLDYTKGIPDRFEAYEVFLEKYPDMHGKVALYQCVVPSRTHVPDYQDLKKLIDETVGRINGKFSRAGWIPLHYVYRSLNRKELLGRYHACELALITPLRDGMNLVAKEYCSSCVDDQGVLVLSEFAGAAEELKDGAILVNPFDPEKTADAIYAGLTMPTEERRDRMHRLRATIKQKDVHNWVRSIFNAAGLEAP